MNSKKLPLLLITPILTLLLNVAIVVERNPFYASWSDPTYDYFFNGLNLASGHFKAGHADHPGTTLQIYSGMTIKFFHWFRSEENIVKDVIANPEWYLFRIGLTSCLLISICIFLAAWMMMYFTGNIFYSLLIQITHLISILAIFFSQNLMTEFILVTTGLLIAPLIVAYSFTKDKRRGQKIIVLAAVLGGIMIAGKISSFPVVVMWVIIGKNLKHKGIYILTAFISFIVFTFPGWHYAPQFFGWIKNMATHTGHYGQGDAGFANWNEFFNNLLIIVQDNWIFTFTFFFISIILIRAGINYSQNSIIISQKTGNKSVGLPHTRTLFGIWIAILLQVFLVSKHYTSHYLIPVHLLVIPAWIILINVYFIKIIPAYTFKWIPLLFTIFLLVKAVRLYNFAPGLKQPAKLLLNIVKPYQYDLLLLDCGITSPFPQPALFFGVNYTGDQAPLYFTELEKNYKDFYFVRPGLEKLNGWRTEVLPEDVLKNNMQILYYSTNDKFNVDSLKWENSSIEIDSVLLSYKLPNSSESVSIFKIKR